MRREGRQRGWVRSYVRTLGDPDGGKCRAVHVVEGAAAGNGGFVEAPAKPTNHSKCTGCGPYKAPDAKVKADKGRYKFKHDEVKTCCLDLLEGAGDYYNFADYE